jgi:hypothetical protein
MTGSPNGCMAGEHDLEELNTYDEGLIVSWCKVCGALNRKWPCGDSDFEYPRAAKLLRASCSVMTGGRPR